MDFSVVFHISFSMGSSNGFVWSWFCGFWFKEDLPQAEALQPRHFLFQGLLRWLNRAIWGTSLLSNRLPQASDCAPGSKEQNPRFEVSPLWCMLEISAVGERWICSSRAQALNHEKLLSL